MKKKLGRPKLKNPKNIDVKIRFTEGFNEKMINFCKENGIKNRSELIRMSVEKYINK